MSQLERVESFVPIETTPLPRPLQRFGSAFPQALADLFVNAYVPEHGIVLDPLAHPWSAADAAERTDRRGIARSTQPLGEWARRVIVAAPGGDEILSALESAAESVLTGTPHRISMRELYGSRCATCRGPVVVEAFLWERDAPAPTKKAFRCGICAREGRALLIEPIGPEDEEANRRVETKGLAYWQFIERFGKDPERQALGEGVAGLYTPRNLSALMATLRAIENDVLPGPARDVLLLAFVEVLVSGSRLNAVAGHGSPLRVDKGRARRGHAAQSREINVWLELERTVRELAAWLDASRGDRPRRTRDLTSERAPAADLILLEAPVDDTLGAWTHVASLVLLGPNGAKPLENGDGRLPMRERLLRTMRQAFLDSRRSASPDAPAVVYLPHAEISGLAACALAGAGAGFRLRRVLYQRDALPTAHGGAAAATLDFERDAPLLKDQPSAGTLAIEDAIRAGVRDAIVARGVPVSTDLAGVAALQALADRRLLAPLALARAGGTSEVELFLDHFRSALGDGKRSGIERVTHDEEAAYTLTGDTTDIAPLEDRVEWGVWGLLSSGHEIDTRTVLTRTYSLFQGIETPDRELVLRCLAAYARQADDGRWRLRDDDTLQKRQADQSLLALQLVSAARRLGFKVHIGRDLRRRPMPAGHAGRGMMLADLMSDVEKQVSLARYARGASEVLDQVDVAWYDRGKMVFLWQLDWTARAHRSVVGLGESIPDDDRVFRFYAMADERQPLLAYKLERLPSLAEVVRRRGWRFVKWAPLRRFATDPDADLQGLEPVLGLDPGVEQAGQQLAFRW
ncbi:MAG: hypothetical protein HY071_06135 [Chloroflexi bacterium]|nr:hypothetical protein [Chloroflexota bacterium]